MKLHCGGGGGRGGERKVCKPASFVLLARKCITLPCHWSLLLCYYLKKKKKGPGGTKHFFTLLFVCLFQVLVHSVTEASQIMVGVRIRIKLTPSYSHTYDSGFDLILMPHLYRPTPLWTGYFADSTCT